MKKDNRKEKNRRKRKSSNQHQRVDRKGPADSTRCLNSVKKNVMEKGKTSGQLEKKNVELIILFYYYHH